MKALLTLAVVVLVSVVTVSALGTVEMVNACAPRRSCIEGGIRLNAALDQGTIEDQAAVMGRKVLLRGSTRIGPSIRVVAQAAPVDEATTSAPSMRLRQCTEPGNIQDVRNRMRKYCRSMPRVQVN